MVLKTFVLMENLIVCQIIGIPPFICGLLICERCNPVEEKLEWVFSIPAYISCRQNHLRHNFIPLLHNVVYNQGCFEKKTKI